MDAGRILNAPREVEIGGRTYSVRDLDLDRQFQLSQWFFDQAVLAVERMPLDEPARDRWRRQVLDAREDYLPGGAVFNAKALTPAGAAKALFLALTDDHPELEEEAVRRWVLDGIEAAARAAVEALGDPKASSPGASAPGARRSGGSGTSTGGRSKKSAASRRRK